MFRERPVPYIPCPRKTPTTTRKVGRGIERRKIGRERRFFEICIREIYVVRLRNNGPDVGLTSVVVGVLWGHGMYGTGLSLSIERQCYRADLDAEKTGEEEG